MASVLFIEDEEDYRGPILERLGQEGIEMYWAEDGRSALDIIHDNKIDLILLDLILPRMDGVEFLYVLRNELHNETPVIVLSNLEETPHKTEISEYLIKANVTIEDLVQKIKEYLHEESESAPLL